VVDDPSGHEALTRDDVVGAWDDDPTWALLRSTNARWVLPLFSRSLEHAEGPVSADWFHRRVSEAQEAIDPEQLATPADHCRGWVDNGWLIRTGARETGARYRLSQHSLRALRIVRETIEHDSVVSEARLGSIAHAVHHLAGLADPSPESQLTRLDDQIAELQRRRAAVASGDVEPPTPDQLARQVREVVRLTASLPEDFRQLSSLVEQRHRVVARRASTEHVGKGALVDQYLRENDLLEQTPEGRAYRGFAQMLSSREIDVMRADIEAILTQPASAEQLSDHQRAQLETLISSLLSEEQSVQETYGRWTSSLRRFLSRTGAERQQRVLTLAERALHAGGAWAERQPGHVLVPRDVLGLGALDVVDVSQLQPWSDRGRPTVEVQVDEGDVALPAADRAALRLTAGTSTAAVAATVERLLDADDAPDEVTSAEVYDATDPEFRRLGLVLSMLDLAVDHGVVADDTETVALTTAGGAVREVTLPRLVFPRRPPRHDGPPGADHAPLLPDPAEHRESETA